MGQRHTALTWMADTGVDLHIVQPTAGHQDPTVRAGYLHSDVQAMLNAGTAFGLVLRSWSRASLGVIEGGKNVG